MGHRGSTNLSLQICFNSTHARLSLKTTKTTAMKRALKINLRSFRFHFSNYAALISYKSNCQELHPYSMLSERKGWVLRMSIALAIHSACRSRVTSHDIH